MKLSVSYGDLLDLLVVANLVSGEKIAYRSKGRGGSASLSGGYCGDWPFESSIYVYAAQDVTKVKGDGKPEKTVNPYMPLDRLFCRIRHPHPAPVVRLSGTNQAHTQVPWQ
jgi:hypothetical protein